MRLRIAIVFGAALMGASRSAAAPGEVPARPVALEEMRQPDANPPGSAPDTALREIGAHRLLDAVDWGGKRFLHYEHRTYWTADSGRTWKSRGWTEPGIKPPRPTMPEARFKIAGSRLFLAAGSGAFAIAAFESAQQDWVRTDFGRPVKEPATAMGGDAAGIYLYGITRELSLSEDGGAVWKRVALVDPPEGGSPYDDIQAEGGRILLRFKRPYGIATAAGSADGGKTWKRFPPGADVHLHAGCFHWIDTGSLRSDCAPEGPDRVAAAPFAKLERLFTGEGGDRFAFADSGVFRLPADPSSAWERAGAAGDWRGWVLAGGAFSLQTADRVRWVSTGHPVATGLWRNGRGGDGKRIRVAGDVRRWALMEWGIDGRFIGASHPPTPGD
jgi:hypothetical protein